MIEEALVEALAQEHFNYIAEGVGVGHSPAAATAGRRHRSSPSGSSRRRWEKKKWSWPWHLLSPQTAMSMVTIVAAAVAARHLRDFLVHFTREAFSTASEGGEGGGGGVVEVVGAKT